MFWEALLRFSFIYCFQLFSNKMLNFAPSLFQELREERTFGQEGRPHITARGWGSKWNTKNPLTTLSEESIRIWIVRPAGDHTHGGGQTESYIKNNNLLQIPDRTYKQVGTSAPALVWKSEPAHYPFDSFITQFIFCPSLTLVNWKKFLLLHPDFALHVILLEVKVETLPRLKLRKRSPCYCAHLPSLGWIYKFNHSRWMHLLWEK